ncbi:helix-turn-helix transcriptional regulator [Devosia sp. XGJD_8]|uniref:helix-turn-helix transcriptional regulator n=1 Tax=Devosia sp. XGJD_8 TaxID=3391187 RepID=UPI003984ED01
METTTVATTCKTPVPWSDIDPAGAQYRVKDVQLLLRISRGKIYEMISSGELPPLIKIGERCSAMPKSWLDAYIRFRAEVVTRPPQ